MKQGCQLCHQLGNSATRVVQHRDECDSTIAAWDHRVQTGQRGNQISNAMNRFGREPALEMFADWTDRIASGSTSDSLLALDPDTGEWVVLRVPYPMAFYSRGLDGRDRRSECRLEGPRAVGQLRVQLHLEHRRRQGHQEQGRALPAPSRSTGQVAGAAPERTAAGNPLLRTLATRRLRRPASRYFQHLEPRALPRHLHVGRAKLGRAHACHEVVATGREDEQPVVGASGGLEAGTAGAAMQKHTGSPVVLVLEPGGGRAYQQSADHRLQRS
jgi:hypothetical protein